MERGREGGTGVEGKSGFGGVRVCVPLCELSFFFLFPHCKEAGR